MSFIFWLQEAKGTDREGAILVGINTGLRRGDLTDLTWGSIDSVGDDTWFLKVKTSKTGKSIDPEREVICRGNAEQLLGG